MKLWGYKSNCKQCGRPIERYRGGSPWVHQNTGAYECEPIKYAFPLQRIEEVWIDETREAEGSVR